MSKYCQNCGTENEDTAVYCKACGAEIVGAQAMQQPMNNMGMQQPNMNMNQGMQQPMNMNNQGTKKQYTEGLIVGILSIPGGLIIAIIGWILGIIGIVINSKHKEECNTTAGLVLSIIGLVLSILNSILGVILSIS